MKILLFIILPLLFSLSRNKKLKMDAKHSKSSIQSSLSLDGFLKKMGASTGPQHSYNPIKTPESTSLHFFQVLLILFVLGVLFVYSEYKGYTNVFSAEDKRVFIEELQSGEFETGIETSSDVEDSIGVKTAQQPTPVVLNTTTFSFYPVGVTFFVPENTVVREQSLDAGGKYYTFEVYGLFQTAMYAYGSQTQEYANAAAADTLPAVFGSTTWQMEQRDTTGGTEYAYYYTSPEYVLVHISAERVSPGSYAAKILSGVQL